MAHQLYWEDVEENMEVTPTPKVATTKMLVMWAGASGDFDPLHYEDTYAASQGVGKPIVHGQLKRAWLVHLVTRWMGDEGTLKKLSCQFRGIDWPRLMKTSEEPQEGETWWCKGVVTKKYIADAENLADCEIWVENGKGEKTTTGYATVALPSRAKIG
ncbi:MaoC family dehydratase [Chloroflexota bacterium]